MQIKAGYKQSEVGLIPEDWDAVPLGSVTSDIGDGIHTTPVYSSTGDFYFINGNNLHAGQIVFTEETKRVEYSEFKKHRKDLGDRSILMSINGTIGNLGLFTGEAVVLGKSAAYLNVRTDVSRAFVYHSLQTELVKRQFADGLTGTTIRNLGLATIRNTRILLPPTKAEQEAIARALNDANALIESLEQLLAKKRQLKQGAMQELLTGKRRLPGFSGEWARCTLDEVCTRTAGFWGAATGDQEHLIAANVIRAGDISPAGDLVASAKRYMSEPEFSKAHCQAGDVVITASGSVGKIWLCDGRPAVAASNFVRVLHPSPRRLIGAFLASVLRSAGTQRLMVEHISVGVLSNLSTSFFSHPWVTLPTVEEQSAIAAILSDMDEEIAVLEAKLAKARALKHGMMQELLTGRIRLV